MLYKSNGLEMMYASMKKGLKPLALAAALVFGPSAVAAPVGVKDVRLSAGANAARVVFDLTGPADYRLFTLRGPDRVVIDIAQGRWNAAAPATPARGYVRALRSAAKDGGLRLVLDTDRAVRAKSYLLQPNSKYGHRLVVDLSEKTPGPVAVKRAPPNPRKYRDAIIAIDAGHGGRDPGAIGRHGNREKHVTLQVSRLLAQAIDRQPGMKSILIRDGDYYLKLGERIQKARKHRADVFVSIHADAFHRADVRGSSVYILSERGATSEAAKWLAGRENAADELMGGVSLDDKDDALASVLLDLSQSATIEASADLAGHILKELKTVGRAHRRRVERAGFAVLKSPDIPSVLVELAFISNPTEEKKLVNRAHQKKMAAAVARGIQRYLYRRPPDGTVFTVKTHNVRRGDTLSALALKYRTTSRQLMTANDLRSDALRVGQVLRIPAAGG